MGEERAATLNGNFLLKGNKLELTQRERFYNRF